MSRKTNKNIDKNQRRRPQQARALAKYNAVLDACTQVLQRNGYAKTSMLELSLESGVAVPTIYQYFENKEEIFVSWINRVVDSVLSQVAGLEKDLESVQVETYIDVLIEGALSAIFYYRKSITELIAGVPHVLSSRVILEMENKTVSMTEELFVLKSRGETMPDLDYKIRTLVRLITGYFIQAIMCKDRVIDVKKEAGEISLVVKSYLKASGVTF